MVFFVKNINIENMIYIIKNIGSYTLKQEYALLSSLQKDNESILFHWCDTRLSELTKEGYNRIKEDFFDSFCCDTLALTKEGDVKIKQEITNVLLCSKKISKNNILFDADNYYEKLREIYFNIIELELVEKIKDIVISVAYNEQTSYRAEFIENRIIYTNTYYLDEKGMEDRNITNVWYCPKTEEEIVYVMKEEMLYAGITINVCDKFDNYRYSFVKIETATDYDLYIFLKKNQKLNLKTMDIVNKCKMQLITIQ